MNTGRKRKILNICILISVYIALYLFTTILFIGLFHTPLFKKMDVLMYRGTIFIVISGFIAAILMMILKHFCFQNLIEVKDIILLFCGCCCINMVLFTLVPVTVERSVSVFMLSYMDENDDSDYSEDDVKKIFVEKYVNDYGAFEKRFNEQLVTGTIQKNEDGKYSITEQGKSIVRIFRIISKWFNTDSRLVYPNEN